MMPPVRIWTRDEMMKRVAFFKDLQGSKDGFPDSHLPGNERGLFNVIGFQQPTGDAQYVSPVGAEASRLAAIPIAEGFNLGFARCKPGNGPLMHNHDTNETFMPITGRWRCEWNEGDPDCEHLLLVVVAGNVPKAEFTPGALAIIGRDDPSSAAVGG